MLSKGCLAMPALPCLLANWSLCVRVLGTADKCKCISPVQLCRRLDMLGLNTKYRRSALWW